MADFDPDRSAPDDSGIYGLENSLENAKVIVVPVPYEGTVSYRRGTSRGPEVILSASRQLDLLDLDTGHPYRTGIFMKEASPEIVRLNEEAIRAKRDEAGIKQLNAIGTQINEEVYAQVIDLLRQQKVVCTVGGEHSVAYGAVQAHAEHFGSFGILQLDAHADLRFAYECLTWSHASVMERVLADIPQVERLVQVGVRDLGVKERARIEEDARIRTFFDPGLQEARFASRVPEWMQMVVEELPKQVYLSFDIDGLDPALCPGTGTPVPGGLLWPEVLCLLKTVAESDRTIIGMDLVEVAPLPASAEWDGNVGARLLYKMIGWTLKSRGLI